MGPDRRPRWSDLRVTWWGHDFIDCARNEVIWRKAGEALGPGNELASFDAWRETLIECAYLVLGRAPDGSRRDPSEESPPPPGA